MKAALQLEDNNQTITCLGNWTNAGINGLQKQIAKLKVDASEIAVIETSSITNMDTAGALLLQKIIDIFSEEDNEVSIAGLHNNYQQLLDLIKKQKIQINQPIKIPTKPHNPLYLIGKEAVIKQHQLGDFLGFIGELTTRLFALFRYPRLIQWRELIITIEETGYTALPIIGLLTFLIGVVLAYQMGHQLQTYGANIYIVDFSAIAILREFAPLITAIVVAGRTSSAFTAQIGTMKLNEEVDALKTMGLSPIDRLVIPKIFALIIALPLLVVWADIFGILGSMFMAKGMLGISLHDFLTRFEAVAGIDNYLVGLSKAPVFALIIATVGCFQGFQVESDADSVGRKTTKSVVQAIFLIIIADAAFSVIYSWYGI